jgi:uncharacterized protein
MLDSNHDLVSELPEHKDAIHELKISNNHFARLMGEYNDLDKKILHIEQEKEVVSDVALENFKKERLLLKDELLAMISEHSN